MNTTLAELIVRGNAARAKSHRVISDHQHLVASAELRRAETARRWELFLLAHRNKETTSAPFSKPLFPWDL